MSDNIHWIVALEVKHGAYAGLEALMKEMVDATKTNEPGAITYEWYVNEDKSVCHICERYADNDAAITHLENFGAHFARRLMSIAKPVSLTVYGDANDAVCSALEGLGAVHMTLAAGFTR